MTDRQTGDMEFYTINSTLKRLRFWKKIASPKV